MAVQVNEFLSGFSLRLVTYILLGSILVLNSFLFWLYSHIFFYNKSPDTYMISFFISDDSLKISSYHLIGYILGIITSSTGLVGIHKNKPKLLMIIFFYFLWYLFYYIVSMILMMIAPNKYNSLICGKNGEIGENDQIYVAPTTFAYLFFIALMIYCVCIVKSCMYDMMKQRSIHSIEMSERNPDYDCEKMN